MLEIKRLGELLLKRVDDYRLPLSVDSDIHSTEELWRPASMTDVDAASCSSIGLCSCLARKLRALSHGKLDADLGLRMTEVEPVADVSEKVATNADESRVYARNA